MPEVSREKLRAMLAEAPEDQREALLTRLKDRGYTLAGQPQPPAGRAAQPVYPQQPEVGKGAAAWDAFKGALGSDIPVLGRAVGAMREDIPNWMAERAGRMQATNPNAAAGGLMMAGAIGTAGELLPKSMGELVTQFLAAKAPAAAKAAKPIVAKAAGYAGDTLAELAGHISGADPEAVKAVFKDPAIVRKFGEKLGQWEQTQLVEAVRDGLKKVGQRFQQVQDGLAGFGVQDRKQLARVDLRGAFQDTVKGMVEGGHRVPRAFTGEPLKIKVGRLDPQSSDYHTVMKWLGNLQKKESLDFGEALNMRRQLDDAINYGTQGNQGLQKVGDEAQKVLKTMRGHVDKALKESLPKDLRAEWEAANGAYAKARTAYDELTKEAVGQTPQTTVTRVLRQIRSGRAEAGLSERAAAIGKEAEAAFQDLHDRVVAAQFKKMVKTGGTGAWGLLTMSSPRMVGLGAAGAGVVSQAADAAARHVMAHPVALAAETQALLRQGSAKGAP